MIDSFEHKVGRYLIAVLFLAGAVQKGVSPNDATTLLIGVGLPAWLIWPAMIFNACAAVSLIFGAYLLTIARLLALYCLATSMFHLIPDDPWQISIMIKNWAIAGGCLILAASARAGTTT
ncbi:MAG: DoxX protein [Pseudomonadota bacterium]